MIDKKRIGMEMTKMGIFPSSVWLDACVDHVVRLIERENQIANFELVFKEIIHQYKRMPIKDTSSPPSKYVCYQHRGNSKMFGECSFEDLKTLDNFLIKGPMVLEIQDFVDISKPLYRYQPEVEVEEGEYDEDEGSKVVQQNLKTVIEEFGGKKKKSGNNDWGGKRLLKVKCSDGKWSVMLIEHQPIPLFNGIEKLVGKKIVIRDVFCKKGMMVMR